MVRDHIKSLGRRIGLTASEQSSRTEKRLQRLEDKLEQISEQSRKQALLLQRLLAVAEGSREASGADEGPAVHPPAGFSAEADSFETTVCPICCGSEATLVCEYNRFLLADVAPDESAKVYNYSLCHACGIVYAGRRPVGRRFRHLLENFYESLGRLGTPSPLLNPMPLTPEARADLLNRTQKGVLVSEHAGIRNGQWLPGALRDRLAVAPHVELLSSLVPLRAPRVLEIRPRTGAILAALRRLYGAEVYALPAFESQQAIVSGLYGITASELVDFDRFRIPYPEPFDLIIANHMLTHAIRPRAFLETLVFALAPGGYVYLYNEMDEGEIGQSSQPVFQVMNPFHMQLYTTNSMIRALGVCGLEPVFITHLDAVHLVCLARKGDGSRQPMPEKERRERVRAWQLARDLAILKIPEEHRSRFDQEHDAATTRAVLAGLATFDEKGRLRFSRKPSRAPDPVV